MQIIKNIIEHIKKELFHRQFVRNGGFRELIFNQSDLNLSSLISKGVDINYQDKYGETALHYACMVHDIKIVKDLILHKAQLEIKNDNGETPLFKICGVKLNYDYLKYERDFKDNPDDSFKIANLLIDAGADVYTQDKYKNTVLTGAAFHRNTSLFIKLLNSGCKHDIKNVNYQDGFDYCLKMKNLDMLLHIYLNTEDKKERKDLKYRIKHRGRIIEHIQSEIDIIDRNFELEGKIPEKNTIHSKIRKI